MRCAELQSRENCCVINSAAGRAVVKIWFTVGGCPVAVTTQKFSSHASLLLLLPLCTSAHVYVNVCGLFLFVCLSCVCVCLYCQPVMENVLGLLPHLVPEKIWLKWTPLVLIGRGQLHKRHTRIDNMQKTENTDMLCVLFLAHCSMLKIHPKSNLPFSWYNFSLTQDYSISAIWKYIFNGISLL